MYQPLYREIFDAAALLREHPPKFRHPHKAALFELAYPDGTAPSASIEVTRWAGRVPASIAFATGCAVSTRPGFYDYAQPHDASPMEWHVNFADPRLFVAYGSALLAQDEMQVVEHPLLGSVREALLDKGLSAKTSDETGPTPVLIRNVERRIEISTTADTSAGRPLGLYGNRFAVAPMSVIRKATRPLDPPTRSNIVAMAAPSGGTGEYAAGEIDFVFSTAYTAFAAVQQETAAASRGEAEAVLHSGFWGCGAFGGNRELMIALQVLAARAARLRCLVIHSGDEAGAEDVRRGLSTAEHLVSQCGSTCTPATLVAKAAMLGCRWGESDGN